MRKFAAIYLFFLIVMITFDMIWLLVVAKNLYQEGMGDLMATEPKLIAGVMFYFLYTFGVLLFVVVPALSKRSLIHALIYGACFGFFCYMTYDLTNLAVIRNFPIELAFIDMAWGSVLTCACAGLTYWLGTKLMRA